MKAVGKQQGDEGTETAMMGYGFGMGLAGWIFMGLFWVAVIALLVVSRAGALTVGTWAATRASGRPGGAVNGPGHGMMGGGMMGGYGLAGNGQRVTSLNAARARAQAFADSLGLRTGEVIQFSNGFYATLLTAERAGATEIG